MEGREKEGRVVSWTFITPWDEGDVVTVLTVLAVGVVNVVGVVVLSVTKHKEQSIWNE